MRVSRVAMQGEGDLHHHDLTDAPQAPAPTRDAAEADDPAAGRARRYLDLWERNLSHLSLGGPHAGGATSRPHHGR
jgi:hypothetical protein